MKYTFASPEWFAALRGMLNHAVSLGVRKSPNFRIAVCEVFYNAPYELARPPGILAWSAVSEGVHVDFRLSERDDVTLKVHADYVFAEIVSRLDTDDPGQAAELVRLSGDAQRTGKINYLKGDAPPPGQASLIHNLLARMTA